MATRAFNAPPLSSSRRVPAAVSVRDRRLQAAFQPTRLQVVRAYLANGDLPPLSAFRAPVNGRPLPGGFPPKEQVEFVTYGALAALGFILVLAGGLG